MRRNRLSLCIVAVTLGWIAAAPVYAGDGRLALPKDAPPDPDGGRPVMILPSGAAALADQTDCEVIGDYIKEFHSPNRYRGDVFHIDQDIDLFEFKMELKFIGVTDLYFSVHIQVPGDPPTFERIFQLVVPSEGDNTRQFYSTGPLPDPVPLEAGNDYAIGVSWGSKDIYYGRDVRSYPRPFVAGQIEGLVAVNTAPPHPSFRATIFTDGVYSMQLCFTGACCLDDLCEDLSEFDCLSVSGEFAAPGVTCNEVIEDEFEQGCPFEHGACCLDPNTDDCLFVNQYACAAIGGAWHHNIACDDPSEPCEPGRGGCCLPDGSCVDDVTLNECMLLGGEYRGDDVGCDAFPPCSAGACCAGEACDFVLTEQDCIDAGGVFIGPGTACDPNPCVLRGACCVGESCTDELTGDDCDDLGGSYRGDYTACDTLAMPCGHGACCVDVAGCVDGSGNGASETFCRDILAGTFQGDGTACDTIDPRCPGVCCWGPPDMCTDGVDPVTCFQTLDGVFAGYEIPCPVLVNDPDPCAGPLTTGACCLTDGSCAETTQDICEVGLSGRFVGGRCSDEPDPCLPPPPVGACCLPDESCEIMTQEVCLGNSGTYHGDATACEPDDLCLVGACCLIDDTCEERSRQRCEAAGGDYQGAGIGCDPNPCGAIVIVSSDPPDCAIDARQPSEPNGSNPDGWNSIDITFSGNASGLAPEDFTIELLPGSSPVPSVIGVSPTVDPDTVTLQLDMWIPTGQWTCLTHDDSGMRTCLGYHPADVNSDGGSVPTDILTIIDNLNGQIDPPLRLWQCDIDRSDECAPADILREIDLLNGADLYEPWLGATLEGCPNVQ